MVTATVVAASLLLFGIGTALNLYYEQVEALDVQLSEEAGHFLVEIAQAPDPAQWLQQSEAREILALLPHVWVYVQDPQGAIILRSADAPVIAPSLFSPRPGFRNIAVEGRRARIGTFSERGLQVTLVAPLEEVEEIVADLMLAYLFALPLAVVAAAVGSWWITHRALAPIAAITATAGEITAQKLDRRLPESDSRDEIAQLTRILNEMFDRLQRAFQSAQRFSADASHELRTPLTIMRGRLEEALRRPGVLPDEEAMLVDLLDENIRLSAIVDSLLLLARADSAQLELHLAEADLTAIAEEVLEDAEILASTRGIALERALPPTLPLRVDAGRLRQVLLNLLDNATKYTEPGGRIRLELRSAGSGCVCTIVNTGPAIPEAKADRIFDRFFRGNEARADDERGSGLGLSICRELIHAHGGRLELAENRDGHIAFQFELPPDRKI